VKIDFLILYASSLSRNSLHSIDKYYLECRLDPRIKRLVVQKMRCTGATNAFCLFYSLIVIH